LTSARRSWELLVERLGLQTTGEGRRTYGRYRVFRDGVEAPALQGFMCECIGPGDNATPDTGLRIEPGRYPLWTQFGRYRSIGYAEDLTTAGLDPMPGFRLEETGARTAILIHPGHPPNLYLSSVGCLNPTRALSASETMDYWDSRARVIALIEDLRAFAPDAFTAQTNTPIDNAFVVIAGEPMAALDG
jgi:hypothetical protein